MVVCFILPQFGIACERARLPHLWGVPLALAGFDGTVRVVSDEASAFGVQPGQSVTAARSLCGALTLIPYDRPAYDSSARLLWDLLAIESSVVEPVSPEVSFAELEGADVLERVRALASAIASRVRIPVLAGVAGSRFVARQAAEHDLDAKVVAVPLGEEAAFLAPLPIDRVPGLDYKLRQRLERLGVRHFGDVLCLPPRLLQRRFADVGLLLYRMAVGKDGERVRALWPPRSLAERVEFEEETGDEAAVREALRRCAEGLARGLAPGRDYCRLLELTVGLQDGGWLRESEKLAVPECAAGPLQRAALRLLSRLTIDRPIVEVSLRACDLGTGSGLQLALLDEGGNLHGLPHERRSRLEATLAFLRKRFPGSAPVLASLLRQSRRVELWTYPLGSLPNQPVQVATDGEGAPLRYWGRRHRRLYAAEVRRVCTRWKETDWFWDSTSDRTVWRVETDQSGMCELHELGMRWHLGAVAD